MRTFKGFSRSLAVMLFPTLLAATQVRQAQTRCVICDSVSEQNFVISTNTAFGPDLDLRPSLGDRSINYAYVHHCPHCSYCAYYLSEPICEDLDRIKAVLASEVYQDAFTDSLLPEFARYFYCRALIEEGCLFYADGGWSAMRAAWECDDYAIWKDDTNARKGALGCRQKAVQLFTKAMAEGQEFATPQGAQEAVLADIMRRMADFEAALKMCKAGLKKQSDKTVKAILIYQRELIRKKDTGIHTTEEATGEEQGAQIFLFGM